MILFSSARSVLDRRRSRGRPRTADRKGWQGFAEHEVIRGHDIERGGVDRAGCERKIAMRDADPGDAFAVLEEHADKGQPIVRHRGVKPSRRKSTQGLHSPVAG